MNYAISSDTKIEDIIKYDVVIVGAGIGGLYSALNIDESLSCLIFAKDNIDISNSWLAQGGIAAAITNEDNPVFHLEDTLAAGAGLSDTEAVRVLVNEGPSDINRLFSMSVPFDLNEFGELHITREGGHHMHRIVHAGGDATGRETVKALSHIVSMRKNITFSGHICFYDILTGDDGVTGIVVRDDSRFYIIETANLIIATGGIGQVYKSSTNHIVATGDGIAAAMRAGAKLANIEFIQFHPTGLWRPTHEGRQFLISEAVRGEGGLLVNEAGERFMLGVHELAELAPRDIVARGILNEIKRSGGDHVYIDITAKSEEFLEQRFPTIFTECMKYGINMAYDKIPVCPVQHYLMGGIVTDLNACTNIDGLYVCGEAANTGVHGANRLASNSMLECLVFGRRAAEHINANHRAAKKRIGMRVEDIPAREHARLDFAQMRTMIQQVMDDHCGVVRNVAGLHFALDFVDGIYLQLDSTYDDSIEYLEILNIATLAKAILEAALRRPESIGSHYMED